MTPDLNDPAETEPCFHCKEDINVEAPHWRIHVTTDLQAVPADYAGADSQGTFALGGECRRQYPEAFRCPAMAPEPKVVTPDLTDPAAFRQAVARLLKAQPSRSEFWTCLLEAADANKVTEADREMVAAGMRRILNFDAPPALHFVNGADGEEVQMAFGYFRGEATAAVFRGSSDRAPIMIPREVLQIALSQGWWEAKEYESAEAAKLVEEIDNALGLIASSVEEESRSYAGTLLATPLNLAQHVLARARDFLTKKGGE